MIADSNAKRNQTQVELFLVWLKEMDEKAKTEPSQLWVSGWYESEMFVCYTRVGKAPDKMRDESTGVATVCLSNIEISDTENRGQGFFTFLIGELTRGVEGLSYSRIECEEVMNPHLGDWLSRQGFRAYGSFTRTYYFDIRRS